MNIINPEEHFFLRVNGDSMNKVVKDGAFALIHKQDEVENGEIGLPMRNSNLLLPCGIFARWEK